MHGTWKNMLANYFAEFMWRRCYTNGHQGFNVFQLFIPDSNDTQFEYRLTQLNASEDQEVDEHIEIEIEENDEVINEIEFNGQKIFFESEDFEDDDEEE